MLISSANKNSYSGLPKEDLQPLVNAWRNSNPMITAFWWDVDRAVKTAIPPANQN